jgi:hypothetical protein
VRTGLITVVFDLIFFTKNNKECTCWTCDFLVGTHQNVILQGFPIDNN